jgi:hypothetical protein
MLLLFLRFDPCALLAISRDLKTETKNENCQAQDIREIWFRTYRASNDRRGVCCSWNAVYDDDRECAKRDPCCLSEEGDEELRWGAADLIEAGVFPVIGGYALEEVGSYCSRYKQVQFRAVDREGGTYT